MRSSTHFQFAEGDENKLSKVLEQFEQYCNPRKKVVLERHQFWQITQKDSETVDQFVTRLKNRVKSCEYSLLVDDIVREEFVFSIQDLQVKERLLREEKLTLEKAISMVRASGASKEQIKAMGPKEQNIENPIVNEIRAGSGRQKKILHINRDQVRAHKQESVRFVVLLTHGDLALLWAKRVNTARSEITL